jgi:type II secretory pathway predicted ATPase ExeA
MTDQIDTKNHPTIKALIAHQERLDLSNRRFAERYLDCSDATWSRIRGGIYPGDCASWLEKWQGVLQTLQDEAESASKRGDQRIVEHAELRAAVTAIKRCANAPQNRLVVYLASTGGGKTTLARKLRDIYLDQVVTVEASEPWRDNYLAGLRAMLDVLNLESQLMFATKIDAETLLIDELARRPRSVVIDEAHYAGKAALNLVKLILNKTQSRVVLLAIPQLWAQLTNKAAQEAAQLRRRTAAKIQVDAIRRDDCQKFLGAKLAGFATLNGAEKEVVSACLTTANRFGYYDTLQRICDEVAEEASETLTADIVRAAIIRVEALCS